MIAIMIYRLLGGPYPRRHAERLAGVRIAVVLRECARCDLEPYPVPPLEDLAGVPKIDVVEIYFPLFYQRRIIHAVAETRPHHAVGEPLGEAVGSDIKQLGYNSGVGIAQSGDTPVNYAVRLPPRLWSNSLGTQADC